MMRRGVGPHAEVDDAAVGVDGREIVIARSGDLQRAGMAVYSTPTGHVAANRVGVGRRAAATS